MIYTTIIGKMIMKEKVTILFVRRLSMFLGKDETKLLNDSYICNFLI